MEERRKVNQVLYSNVESLYKRMFLAEQEGDITLAKSIKKQLDSIIMDEIPSREEFTDTFLEERKKKFVFEDLHRLYTSHQNELQMSITICSVLTHSFLEARDNSLHAYRFLDIKGQIELLQGVLEGEVTQEDVKQFYKETLPTLQKHVDSRTKALAEGERANKLESTRRDAGIQS